MLVTTLFKSYECDAFEEIPERLDGTSVFGLEEFIEVVNRGISQQFKSISRARPVDQLREFVCCFEFQTFMAFGDT